MDKISGILPTSHRFRKIDISESHSARPGAPSLGRREGYFPGKDRVELSPAALRMAFEETLGSPLAAQPNPDYSDFPVKVAEIQKQWNEGKVAEILPDLVVESDSTTAPE